MIWDVNGFDDKEFIFSSRNKLNRTVLQLTDQLREAGIDVVTELSDDIFGIVMGNDNELTFVVLFEFRHEDIGRLASESFKASLSSGAIHELHVLAADLDSFFWIHFFWD